MFLHNILSCLAGGNGEETDASLWYMMVNDDYEIISVIPIVNDYCFQ